MSCQRAHSEIVKKLPLIKLLHVGLFILETVINYSLLPPLKFHLGSRHFLLLLQKQPLQPKLFNSGLNTLID